MRSFWRRKRQPAQRAAVLGSYTSPGFWQRHRIKLLALVAFYSWFVGMFYAVTTTYFLVQLCAPLALIALLIIWLLPDAGWAPTRAMSQAMFVFLAVVMCWPDYIGIDLPGLPWITLSRLVALPLTGLFLVSLSISAQFRHDLAETLAAVPWVWRLLTAFAVIAFLSILWSTSISISANKFSVALFNWFVVFFVAVYVFRTPGRLLTFAYLLWGSLIFVSLIGLVEWRLGHVPWSGHLPSIFTIQDETVTRILAGSVRSAVGAYRVQSKFSGPIGLAEFYAFALPFLLHFALTHRSLVVRIAAVASFLLSIKLISLTDSRLGMVGLFLSMLFYLLFWGARHRRLHPNSPVGTMVVLGYPAVFIGFIPATFYIGRLRHLIWGSGAEQASTDTRVEQIHVGLPKVFERPWGWGIGRGGDTLNMDSIDNYYLSVALEYGVVGFVIYFTMFGIAVFNGLKRAITFPEGELALMVPLTIALMNFMVVKLTFSQQDTHALVFAMLGALVACCWRFDRETAASAHP